MSTAETAAPAGRPADARGRRGRGRVGRGHPARPAAERRDRAARCAASCPACPGCGSRPASPGTPAGSPAAAGALAAELAKVGVGRSELGPAREGPPLRRGGLGRATRCSAHPAGLPGGRRRRPAGWSTTPSSTGATTSGWASSSTTWSTPPPPATTRSSTRRCSSGSSTPAAATSSRAAAASSVTSPPPRGCPRWSSPTRSRSAPTSRSRPARWCCAPTMFELIQYTPQTTEGPHGTPLLIVPPTINKYYVIDLAEQRSLVEHLVANGQQVYCISWRNPDARHADWGLDTYGQAIIEAMDASREDLAPGPGGAARHLLGRHARLDGARPPRGDRRPRPGRGVQPRGDRPRPGAGRAAECAAVPQGGRGLDEGVPGEGLPRRTDAGRGVRLAAAQRPDLELLGQQLPARARAPRPSTSSTGTPTRSG